MVTTKIQSTQNLQQGFTLIELMIVVAIIGILSAIAYPSYIGYIEKTNRADVMAEMQQIALRIDANKITYKRYDRIPLTSILSQTPDSSGTVAFPSTTNHLYNLTISPINSTTLGSSKWSITATPESTGRMQGNGNLSLDSTGKKCWKTKCGFENEWRDS